MVQDHGSRSWFKFRVQDEGVRARVSGVEASFKDPTTDVTGGELVNFTRNATKRIAEMPQLLAGTMTKT